MHHGATSEVKRTFLEQEARRGAGRLARSGVGVSVGAGPEPHHVCHREISEGKPDDHEQQHRGEADAFSEGTDDQAAGDCCEGTLEDDVGQFGDDDAFAEGGGDAIDGDPFEEEFIECADEGIAFGKGQRVTKRHPQHADQGEGDEDLNEHREHVLGANESAVEQGQPGNRHQDDEGGTDHHPGVVALVGDQGGSCRGNIPFGQGGQGTGEQQEASGE